MGTSDEIGEYSGDNGDKIEVYRCVKFMSLRGSREAMTKRSKIPKGSYILMILDCFVQANALLAMTLFTVFFK